MRTYVHLGPNSSMHIRIINEQTLFMRHEEVTAVCDGAGRSATVARRVHVRIEMNDGDGAINLVEGPEDGKHNGMVTSKT